MPERVSFCATTSFEKTERFVATISNNSLISLDFKVSELFFIKFEKSDSIAPNFESNTLWRSSRLSLSSARKFFIESISSSVLSFSNLELMLAKSLSTSDVFSTP